MCVSHMSYGLKRSGTYWATRGGFASGSNFVFDQPGQIKHETMAAMLMYTRGAVAQITASFASPRGFPTGSLKAYGPKGGFALQILETPCGTFWQDGEQQEMTSPPGADDLTAQCQAFVAALHGHGELLNPAEDSRVELRIIEGIVRSALLREPVMVP